MRPLKLGKFGLYINVCYNPNSWCIPFGVDWWVGEKGANWFFEAIFLCFGISLDFWKWNEKKQV